MSSGQDRHRCPAQDQRSSTEDRRVPYVDSSTNRPTPSRWDRGVC